MSIHKSLVSRDMLKRQRSVLTRAERIEKLMEDEKWEDEMSVFGLPKVKVEKVKKKAKAKEAAEEAEAGAEGAVEAGAEAEAAPAEDES